MKFFKKFYYFLFIILSSCQTFTFPNHFIYKEIQTSNYKIASWQKILNNKDSIHIYIEGDGYSFNHYGESTSNPTPRITFLRKIAINDTHPNVIYLARPCQYVKDNICSQIDWTTGRFSQKIINSMAEAIKNIYNNQSIILIGYSGGALLSGLIIEQNQDLPIKKWITLAGLLNHKKWTESLKLTPLTDSIDLEKLPNIEQIHLIGNKDKIISYKMIKSIVPLKNLIIISNATHNSGFENYLSIIYNQ